MDPPGFPFRTAAHIQKQNKKWTNKNTTGSEVKRERWRTEKTNTKELEGHRFRKVWKAHLNFFIHVYRIYRLITLPRVITECLWDFSRTFFENSGIYAYFLNFNINENKVSNWLRVKGEKVEAIDEIYLMVIYFTCR